MSRLDAYLKILDDPVNAPPLDGPAGKLDDALACLLVHVACGDGLVQDAEFALFERLMPGKDAGEILAWVAEIATLPFDVSDLLRVLPEVEDRRKALEFAVRIAWADRHLAAREHAMLRMLAGDLDLDLYVLDETLSRVAGAGHTVPPEQVTQAVQGMPWSVPVDGEAVLADDIVAVLPPDATLIARIVVDTQPCVGLFSTGIAARFREGPAFVPWSHIARYARVPTLGAALTVDTHDGRSLSLVDPRLRDVGLLLDRIYASSGG